MKQRATIRASGSTKSAHSDRLERWIGSERLAQLSNAMRGWYGPPIHLLDCPGSVRMCGDGDFIGPFDRGYAVSAAEAFRDDLRRRWHALGRHNPAVLAAGFTSIGDALARASQGYSQPLNGTISKAGPTKVVGSASSLWRVGTQPVA
jgi:hypothetical protein